MNTPTLSKKDKQIQELTEFAHQLKENGFTVIVSATYPFNWLHYEKNGRMGTVSADYFYGYNFATVNRPSTDHGTGYATARETELSITNAEASLTHPRWAYNMSGGEKYKSAKDFIEKTENKWAEYYIL